MNTKKITAREWLYFVSLSLLGIILTVILYFPSPKDYVGRRQTLYETLTKHYRKVVATKSEKTTYDIFDEISDTTMPLGTFEQFSARLDDQNRRKALYDSASVQFDLDDYQTFEGKVMSPTMLSGFSKFWTHLFSKWYWRQTWAIVLIPYLFFQFVRSLIYSIRTLRQK